MTEWKTNCTERDSVTDSASPACLGPEGLPTPRRSFVCFRLSARCETDSRGTGGGSASGSQSGKALAAGKALDPLNAAPANASERPRKGKEMTERLPFRPLCLRTVASKGVCTPAKLQPTAAGARCKGEATGPAPAGASDRHGGKPLRAGKASNSYPSRACVRYWEPAWSGVRAAEGARLEIAWAGSTRLEGSNPSHSASIPGRCPGV